MATLSNNIIARGIHRALKDKSPSEVHKVHESIIKFLVRKRLMGRASAILDQLKKIINFENGIVAATVKSAHRLHEKEEKDLIHFFKKRYSAKKITLSHILDKKLLGGVRLEVNDEVIDLTIKNKITQLKEYLTKPA